MALDFPSNPTNGQAYGSYIYNSIVGAWQSKEDPATVATVSTSAPTSANPGDLWYDSDDGTSYMYYDDGTSAQWVELLSSGLPLLNTKADIAYVDSQDDILDAAIQNNSSGISQLFSSKSNLVGDNSFSGGVNYYGAGALDGTFISSNTGRAQFTVNSSTSTPLIVRGATSQTADLQQWLSPAGAVVANVNSNGALNTKAVTDLAYRRIVNPDGAMFTTTSNAYTGAIRITLPVGWTSHMHKFNVSVFNYNSLKSFDVSIAGYNYTGGNWVNPTAYILGNQDVSVNYTVRFGYTAGGKACIYIGEVGSTWSYPQIAVNNVLVGFGASSSAWLSGWSVDFVTAFENVTQTVANTQIVAGLVPLVPTSVSVNSGSASVSADGTVSFSGGVTNLRVNGCFSSTYKYYRVMFEIEATSAGMDLMFQLINLGSGYSYARIGTYSGPTFTQTYVSGSAAAMLSRSNGGNGSAGWLDVFNPGHAKTKRFLSQSVDSGFALWLGTINGDLGTYSDFQIYSLQGGTLTSGSLKVYGYR